MRGNYGPNGNPALLKNKYKIIGISFLFGIGVWFIDAVLDYLAFYKGHPFLHLMVSDVPGHEIYIRSPILASFLVFGVVIARFIERQRRAEWNLRESEARFAVLYENMKEGVCLHEVIYDDAGKPVDYRILDANPVYEALTGLARDQVSGKKASEVYGTEDAPYLDIYAEVAETGRPASFDVFFPPMEKHFLISAVSTSKGKFATVFSDITDRKQAEIAVKDSEAKYRAIFEHTSNGVAVYEVIHDGEDFIFTDFNRQGEKIEDVSREEVIGRSVLEVFSGVKELGLLEVFKRVYKTGKPEHHPVGIYKDDRMVGWRENYVYKLPSGQVVAVYSDETERMQAQEEREALIRELETKNAELERFTYTVSHDLKNPLITIRGFLGMVEKDVKRGDLDRMRSDMNRIRDAADKMSKLLDELLALSRIGRVADISETIPFGELAQEAVDSVYGHLDESGIRVDIADDLPEVFGDGARLREVLENLLSNAIKFMGDQPDPHIEIGVQERGTETVFFVKDNGIGIDPKYQDKVFGLFNQLDQTAGGTGVGLAIVKRIVEVHGGRIWIESSPGKGAGFFFTLPGREPGRDKTKEEEEGKR